jgi:hypothetical protein
MRLLSWLCLTAAVIASGAFIAATVPQLPAHVSSHFVSDGRANGWMTRDAYLTSTLAMAVLLPMAVAGLLSVVPRVGRRGLSIPHRDYWFASDRRDKTAATLGVFACWLGVMLAIFFAAIHYTILEANASVPARLPAMLFFVVMACFFAAMLLWVGALHVRFRKPR